jgi:CRP/FNR family transcriptional regulator, cyclic AMP receptor protein
MSRRIPFKVVSGDVSDQRAASAMFLSETAEGLNDGANFLQKLTPEDVAAIRAAARAMTVREGDAIFRQGERHDGIFLIEAGRVRVFYTGPSGCEITLAYWTPGHFIGGPEIYGGGRHIWSGEAVEDCRVSHFTGAVLRKLIAHRRDFAACLIEGLVAKGKCYSALVQMLGTRSVIERLAQFLLNMGQLYGDADGARIVIRRTVTHDQIASMVGATRQWVTMTLDRFQKNGIITITRHAINIEKPDLLRVIVGEGPDD